MKRVSFTIHALPAFSECSFRYFYENEKHINRVFNYYVLIFMLKRELYFHEDGEPVALSEGEWYMQVPGLVQEGLRGCPSPEYFYIHFSVHADAAQSADIAKRFHIPIRGTFEKARLTALFEQLDELYRKFPWDVLGQQAVFLSILNHISDKKPGSILKGNSFVYDILDDLHRNYNKPLSMQALSNKYNYSKDYIARRMKKETGLTPFDYVQTIRMQTAKELLSNTDYAIESISHQVGYGDVSLFYKAFKSDAHMTPGQWRRRSRGS